VRQLLPQRLLLVPLLLAQGQWAPELALRQSIRREPLLRVEPH
jgi:hypothetical protein